MGASFKCLNPIVEDLLSGGVKEGVLDLFPEEVFDLIATDSPDGFTHGEVVFDQDPAQEDLSMNFEAMNSSVILSGKFATSTGTEILEGKTRVRAYSELGLHAEAFVSVGGDFTITLTDIVPGHSPFILVFVTFAALTSVNQVVLDSTKTPPKRRLVANEGAILFWCINPSSACKAKSTLTFRLTWDKPNDVDLHVIEPSGNEVAYWNKSGDYGLLDFDNQDGFGPEHYIAQSVATDQIYKAWVHLYGSDPAFVPVNFNLDAYYASSILWRQSGTLIQVNVSSKYFNVTIPVNDLSCESCNIEDNALAERNLISSIKEPVCCKGIDEWKWHGLWHTNEWKVKVAIKEMKANKKNFLFYFNAIVAPVIPFTAAGSYEQAVNMIDFGKGNYECLREPLLKFYCTILFGKSFEAYLSNVLHFYDGSKLYYEMLIKRMTLKDAVETIGGISYGQLFIYAFSNIKTRYYHEALMAGLLLDVSNCNFDLY